MSRRRSRITDKRRKRAKDELQSQRQMRNNFNRILGLMGLSSLRNELSEEAPSVLARVFPKPRVVPDPRLASDNDLRVKAEELHRDLRRVSIRIGHATLSHADFFTICVGLHYLVKGRQTDSTIPGERRDWEHAMSRLMRFVERYEPEMMAELEEAIRKFLALNSRLDGPIYTVRHGTSIEGRKLVCTTTLGRISPETLAIEADGVRRRAFRCGAMEDYDTGEITWISWGPEVIGGDTSGQLPVYIQSHAIAQAYKRLAVNEGDRSLHYLLVKAMRHPRITPGRDGHLLVEVRLGEERIGYLVSERLSDKVLVKTFLLITMQGTPEGARLHRRLRMSRADLEYLELDNFAKLAFTDLLKDDDIAGIFRECSCEGLLALARYDYPFEILGGFATQFKTYFGRALASPLDHACRELVPGLCRPSRAEEGSM